MNQRNPADPLSRLALEWTPIHLLDRADLTLDIFKHSVSATDGLPPYAQARIIDLISNQLKKARPRACLWVSVDAPGSWFVQELQRLVKRRIPTVILPADQAPTDAWDFKPQAFPHHANESEYLWMDRPFKSREYEIKIRTLRILRILARLKKAYTREITSLAGFSETYVRNLLKELRADKLIGWEKIGKYDGWVIRNKGLRLVHRSWNVPKGVHFAQHRGEFRYAGERHRRVSRLWRAWLEKTYLGIEIWECWTEVPVHYGIPDALAWGTHRGRELLFWLEVDSGHSSRKRMVVNYRRRLQLAYAHAHQWQIPIVFCVMGPPWVVDEFRWCIPGTDPWVAIIGHDWRDFGRLPVYEFGRWNENVSTSHSRRSSRSSKELPFDPKQYPPKPKQITPKLIKPKSTKLRFDKGSLSDEADWFRSRSEREE